MRRRRRGRRRPRAKGDRRRDQGSSRCATPASTSLVLSLYHVMCVDEEERRGTSGAWPLIVMVSWTEPRCTKYGATAASSRPCATRRLSNTASRLGDSLEGSSRSELPMPLAYPQNGPTRRPCPSCASRPLRHRRGPPSVLGRRNEHWPRRRRRRTRLDCKSTTAGNLLI